MIKYIKDSYPEKRNIINIIESQEYLKENKKYDFFRYIDYVMSRMNIKTINYKFIHYSFSREDYLYHLFNTISLNKDYIVTFESCVPRIDSVLNITNKEVIIKNKFLFKILINSLSSERCKAIIPMSKNAYNIQNELYKNIDERMKNKLLSKTKILHPPQDINEKIKEFNSEEIVFTFIGSDFYRKGGGEIVRVFNKFKNKNIKLNLIGDIDYKKTYIDNNSSGLESEIKNIIANDERINHKKKMTPSEIKSLLAKTDIGLLPTWADTYGYSVLEFQSYGIPVITTNIRAILEINNDDIGWVIKLPLTKLREIDLSFNCDYLRDLIEIKMFEIFSKIIADPSLIISKGNKAQRRIKDEHSLSNYEKELKIIVNK